MCILQLEIMPVMPMVMRGLAVPDEKSMFIIKDCAREAAHWGFPFGTVCDPGNNTFI